MSISNIARGIFDDDFKKMIKVGWLDGSLNLTTDGRDAVLTRYLMKNKEAFAEMAQEILTEEIEE